MTGPETQGQDNAQSESIMQSPAELLFDYENETTLITQLQEKISDLVVQYENKVNAIAYYPELIVYIISSIEGDEAAKEDLFYAVMEIENDDIKETAVYEFGTLESYSAKIDLYLFAMTDASYRVRKAVMAEISKFSIPLNDVNEKKRVVGDIIMFLELALKDDDDDVREMGFQFVVPFEDAILAKAGLRIAMTSEGTYGIYRYSKREEKWVPRKVEELTLDAFAAQELKYIRKHAPRLFMNLLIDEKEKDKLKLIYFQAGFKDKMRRDKIRVIINIPALRKDKDKAKYIDLAYKSDDVGMMIEATERILAVHSDETKARLMKKALETKHKNIQQIVLEEVATIKDDTIRKDVLKTAIEHGDTEIRSRAADYIQNFDFGSQLKLSTFTFTSALKDMLSNK